MIKKVKERISTRLLPLKNKIFFSVYFKLLSLKNQSQQLDDFEDKKILVLAPHIDDDIIGCGGTMYNYCKAGSSVRVIYLTDGSKSRSKMSKTALIKKRKDEAKKVASILGISSIHFLDYIDGELNKNLLELKNDLGQAINIYEPDIIFAPFFLDRHPDHLAVVVLLPELIADFMGQCYLYDVEYPISHIFINIYTEIDKTIKEKACAAYSSQNVYFDKLLEFECMRSKLFKSHSRCTEAFYKYSREDYKVFLSQIKSGKLKKMSNIKSIGKSKYMIKSYLDKTNLEKEMYDRLS